MCAAHCLCHILRIYAPESPYTTTQLQVMSATETHTALHVASCSDPSMRSLQDIFGLFMWVFRKLENPSSPAFQLTLSVLDIITQASLAGLYHCHTLLVMTGVSTFHDVSGIGSKALNAPCLPVWSLQGELLKLILSRKLLVGEMLCGDAGL